jgi:3'(2'), 5'-bisphosphate nucleotidase
MTSENATALLLQHDPKAAQINIPQLLQTAQRAAEEAGAAILEVYTSGDFEVNFKSDASPLTKADRLAHNIICRHLHTTGLPMLSEEGSNVPFQERTQWLWYWLVDPLDGTKEFIQRNGEFTVNIALMQKDTPVAGVLYAPCLHTLYYGSAETGVYKETGNETIQLAPLLRRENLDSLLQKPGVSVVASRQHNTPETEQFISQFKQAQTLSLGSSLKFMLLAENKAAIYPRFAPTMEWDTAAAHALLNALNRGIYVPDLKTELIYNKPNLLNPSFVAF